MDFSRLEKSIMDVIKEEQAKLGYRKEKIRLYYPLSSLNHFFQVEGDVTGMLEKLNWFPEYTKQRLGQVEVTNEGERFFFHIPEEGVEYVHEQMKENEFIKELIGLLQKHDCTMEEIFDLFRSHSEKVEIHEMDNGEFDYRVSFADDPEDSYIYCFKDEGCHIIYHRFLPEEDRLLIRLRFYANRTQSETAKVLHTTQVQISRRERKILRKMRERLLE